MAEQNYYNRPGIGRPVQGGGILHPVSRTGAYASGGVGLGPGNSRQHHRRNRRTLRDNILGISMSSLRIRDPPPANVLATAKNSIRYN